MTAKTQRRSIAAVYLLFVLAVLLGTLGVLLVPADPQALRREVGMAVAAAAAGAAVKLLDALDRISRRGHPVDGWVGAGEALTVEDAKTAVAGTYVVWLALALGGRLLG